MVLSSNKMHIVVVIKLTLVLSSIAQNSPQDYVNAHNAARALVGVGPITWNDNVASYAQKFANSRGGDCNLMDPHSGGPYGENVAWGSSDDFSGIDAVNLWVNEKQFYDPGSNSCALGEVCGHYTQVVWSTTTYLGCAPTSCNNGGWYVICSYNPPGNFVGARPYSIDDTSYTLCIA